MNAIYWTPGMTLDQVQKQTILIALEFYKNNKTQAAKSLGITTKTIYNKLHEYGIDVSEMKLDYGSESKEEESESRKEESSEQNEGLEGEINGRDSSSNEYRDRDNSEQVEKRDIQAVKKRNIPSTSRSSGRGRKKKTYQRGNKRAKK